MVLGRKFIIWFVSFIVVLGAFLLYRGANDAGVIEITTLDSGVDVNDANMFFADANAGQIGQAKLKGLRQARFDTVDAKTRKLKRSVGFEKVLHSTGDLWELDKPYMNVFQGKLRCDITSDTGTIEIENVEGSNPSPKSAVLKNNVIIHIMPETTASMSDSFIYLNEVTFDSDRSMFFSDNDVNFISADAHLVGKGLEVVYNSITNRLEYLKIMQVDYLNITSVQQAKKAVEKKAKKETAVAAPSQPAAQSQPAQSPPVQVQPAKAETIQSKPQSAKKSSENYKCLFQNQATLEYGNEVVMADEIAIINLIWSSDSNSQQKPEKPVEKTTAPAADKTVVASTDKAVATPVADKTVVASADKAVAIPADKPAVQADANTIPQSDPAELQKKIMSEFQNRPVVAIVKCKGSMIVKPDSYARSDDYKYAEFKKFEQLPDDVRRTLGRRNVLISQRVSYDYTDGIAKAYDDVEIFAYPKTQDANNIVTNIEKPFVISAKKGAEFLTKSNQAIFYGKVKGIFSKQAVAYNEENTFYGDKLIVDLISADTNEQTQKQSQSATPMSANVAHIAVIGPGVRLESARTLGEKKLSHIRLKSKQIDYDKITENIIASGKGQIEYAREDQPVKPDANSQSTANKPCYTIVEGFDKLTWDANSKHVRAVSDKTNGIHIGYMPFTLDKNRQKTYGKKITIDTRQIDIDYVEPVKGQSQIAKLFATGGVVFYEQDRWEFAGKELSYYAKDDFLAVSGSQDIPCMLNGAFVDGIEYNLKTGSASGVIGKGVGIMPAR